MNNEENKNWSDLLFAHDDSWSDYKLEEIVFELEKDGSLYGEEFNESHSHLLTIDPLEGCRETLTFESYEHASRWLEEATYFNTGDEVFYTIRDKNLTELHTQFAMD